jgi:predicted small secreted protein
MRKSAIVNMFLAILFIVTAGCATMQSAGHKYMMKGQILDVSDGVAYLCIGSAEGAKEGQEFPVYRYVRLPYSGAKQATPSYKREEVGAVKITQVVEEHYARADILRGDIKTNDVAELSP